MKESADKFWVFALICGTLWFCSDLLIDGAVPFYRDLTNYFYPLRYSLYESFRAGELPLWDRQFAQGFPNLAAFQSGVFYPPHWLLALQPFFAAIRTIFILHFLIAAIGTYQLLRRWQYSGDLAFAGAVLFAFGGTVVSLSNLLNHFQSAVWLPWIVLSWECLLLDPNWRRFLAFTILSALQLLAGSPELALFSTGLAMLYGVQLRVGAPQITWRRMAGLALASQLLMIALLMVQLLPMIELIMQSRRGHSVPAQESLMWSLNPMTLLNIFFLDKEVDTVSWLGMRLYFTRNTPFLISNYMGAISLVGVALWVVVSSRRERLYLTFLVLFSLAFALGNNALIYPFLLGRFPFLSAVRFPEKFFFVTHVLLLLMTFRGIKALFGEHWIGFRKLAILLGTICSVWVVAYALLMYRSEILARFIAENSNIPAMTDQHAKATAIVLANVQRQVILLLALCGVALLAKANKLRPSLVSILFAAVVYFDLSSAHKAFLFPIQPDRFYKTAPVIQARETKLSRFFFYPAPNNLHPAFFSVLGTPKFAEAVALSFQNYLPNVGVMQGIEYFQEIDALGRRPYGEFLAFANEIDLQRQVKLLSVFNVKHLVSFRELPEKGLHLIGRFPKYYSWLYEIPSVVPRAYLVNQVLVEKEPAKVLPRLAAVDFKPLEQVILDAPSHTQAVRNFTATSSIERYENQTVTVKTAANGDAILVLADAFYPGWLAYVDGKETPILRANHFYRAVALPKGEHHVEFRYSPKSFQWGMAISLLTAFGLLGGSFCRKLRQRKMAAVNEISVGEVLRV